MLCRLLLASRVKTINHLVRPYLDGAQDRVTDKVKLMPQPMTSFRRQYIDRYLPNGDDGWRVD